MKLGPAFISTTVYGCSRCGQDHLTNISFTAFKDGPINGNFTHYGMCPTMNQPLLLRVLGEKD